MVSTKRLLAAGILVGVLIGIAQIVGVAQGGTISGVIGCGVYRKGLSQDQMRGRSQIHSQPCGFSRSRTTVLTWLPQTRRDPSCRRPRRRRPTRESQTFGPFTRQAGTDEIKGNELTIKPIAAKHPDTMRAGAFGTITFRMEGKDTLWLTQKASQNGPTANPTTTKLTRMGTLDAALCRPPCHATGPSSIFAPTRSSIAFSASGVPSQTRHRSPHGGFAPGARSVNDSATAPGNGS